MEGGPSILYMKKEGGPPILYVKKEGGGRRFCTVVSKISSGPPPSPLIMNGPLGYQNVGAWNIGCKICWNMEHWV